MTKIFVKMLTIAALLCMIASPAMAAGTLDYLDLDRINILTPGAKNLYVMNTSNPLYAEMHDILPPYKDGVKRLYSNISDAYTACITGRGDRIILLPGYSEDLSTPLSITKNNITIQGPDNKDAKIYGGYAGTSYTTCGLIDIVGASGVTLKNFVILPYTSGWGVDGAVRIEGTIASPVTGNTIDNVDIVGASYQAGDGVADSNNFDNCIIVKDAVRTRIINSKINTFGTYGCNSFVKFTGGVTDTFIKDNVFVGQVSTTGIYTSAYGTTEIAGSSRQMAGFVMVGNVVCATGTTVNAVDLLGPGPYQAIVARNRFAGTGTTIASIAAFGTFAQIADNHVLEGAGAGAVQATNIIPALDTE